MQSKSSMNTISIDSEELIVELKDAKNKGQLIPFVGSGCSFVPSRDGNSPYMFDTYPSWEELMIYFVERVDALMEPANKIHSVNHETITALRGIVGDCFSKGSIVALGGEKKLSESPLHVAGAIRNVVSQVKSVVNNYALENYLLEPLRYLFEDNYDYFIPQERHKLLVSSDYDFILTTNYDRLLTKADKETVNKYTSISFLEARKFASAIYNRKKNIVHVHGNLESSDPSFDHIVLAPHEYQKLMKNGYPAFRSLMRVILSRYSVLYMGYGRRDPHVEDLMSDLRFLIEIEEEKTTNTNEGADFLTYQYEKQMSERLNTHITLPTSYIVLAEDDKLNIESLSYLNRNVTLVTVPRDQTGKPMFETKIDELLKKLKDDNCKETAR